MNCRSKALPSLLLLLVMSAALAGCAGSTTAVVDSLKYAVRSNADLASLKLNPEFRYLRAAIDGRAALLVLGYVDQHPQGPIEVWYSAEREVLRLQNGRIVGATGLTTEWRNVRLSASPKWASMPSPAEAASIRRVRDVMPGYRYGVEDLLVTKPISAPARSSLIGVVPESLAWFEESVAPALAGAAHAGDDSGATSRFAVRIDGGTETVVYGEQCLSRQICLSWQRWPPPDAGAQASQVR